MREEHIKDTQLDNSLIRTRSQTIEDLRSEPLSCATKRCKPDSCTETKDGCDEEYRSTTDFHRCWNPEDVHESLQMGG